jgi:hypothetical protein
MTNPYEKELTELKQKVAELENKIAQDNKPKSVCWDPKGNLYRITSKGSVERSLLGLAHDEYVLAGAVRDNKQQAEKATAAIRKYVRLLAYKDEFAPDYNPDFTSTAYKYYVYLDVPNTVYCVSNCKYTPAIGNVYMPEEVANELARKLNSGEVVL